MEKRTEHFPKWNPQYYTQQKMVSSSFKIRFSALRNSSDGFIHKKEVRKIIMDRDNNKCVECGNKSALQIDHIISVYKAAKYPFLIEILNTKNNLQTLCRSCNSSKAP